MRNVNGEDAKVTQKGKQFQRETVHYKKHCKFSVQPKDRKARENPFRKIFTTEMVEATLYKVQHTPAADSYLRDQPTPA